MYHSSKYRCHFGTRYQNGSCDSSQPFLAKFKSYQSVFTFCTRSLSSLGDVIQALTSGQKVVPYRNSKLTQLMSDSLGGNAKTLMFVNISPASCNAQESNSSLEWATRAKKIQNKTSKNESSAEVAKLKAMITTLSEQLELAKKGGGVKAVPEQSNKD